MGGKPREGRTVVNERTMKPRGSSWGFLLPGTIDENIDYTNKAPREIQ